MSGATHGGGTAAPPPHGAPRATAEAAAEAARSDNYPIALAVFLALTQSDPGAARRTKNICRGGIKNVIGRNKTAEEWCQSLHPPCMFKITPRPEEGKAQRWKDKDVIVDRKNRASMLRLFVCLCVCLFAPYLSLSLSLPFYILAGCAANRCCQRPRRAAAAAAADKGDKTKTSRVKGVTRQMAFV